MVDSSKQVNDELVNDQLLVSMCKDYQLATAIFIFPFLTKRATGQDNFLFLANPPNLQPTVTCSLPPVHAKARKRFYEQGVRDPEIHINNFQGQYYTDYNILQNRNKISLVKFCFSHSIA